MSGKQTFRYKVMSLQVVLIRPQALKLLKNFDHFTYNLRLNDKNILSDYSSFFKPSTQNYLHVDWTLTCIETYMTSCELRAQQSPTIIILPCTFHLEKTCSVGWSVWRVLKSSSWAKATLPAQLTNHDMIFSQKQSENIQEGKFEETRHNKLGSHAFVIICLHAWSGCFRWPIVSTFHLLSTFKQSLTTCIFFKGSMFLYPALNSFVPV